VEGLTRFFQFAFEMRAIPEIRPLNFLPMISIDDLSIESGFPIVNRKS
jgi:hypothetical protein